MRHPISPLSGTGILTSFPSTTPFSLALGTDLPWEDCLNPGNLRLSADRNLTCLFVTHACILTSHSSTAARAYRFNTLGNAPLPPVASY